MMRERFENSTKAVGGQTELRRGKLDELYMAMNTRTTVSLFAGHNWAAFPRPGKGSFRETTNNAAVYSGTTSTSAKLTAAYVVD